MAEHKPDAFAPPPRRRRRFSIPELVVLLTTLVVIAALLTPVLVRAHAAGEEQACADNLRNLMTWMRMYQSDYGGELPAWQSWTQDVADMPDLVSFDADAPPRGAFQCPSQQAISFSAGQSPTEYWRGSHYGINQHMTSDLKDEEGRSYPQWGRVNARSPEVEAAWKVLIADASGGNYFGVEELPTTIAGISRRGETWADALPPKPASPFPYLRHRDDEGPFGNFLYLDGAVRKLRSWPTFMSGPGTPGYEFWHAQHWYPGSGKVNPDAPPSPGSNDR